MQRVYQEPYGEFKCCWNTRQKRLSQQACFLQQVQTSMTLVYHGMYISWDVLAFKGINITIISQLRDHQSAEHLILGVAGQTGRIEKLELRLPFTQTNLTVSKRHKTEHLCSQVRITLSRSAENHNVTQMSKGCPPHTVQHSAQTATSVPVCCSSGSLTLSFFPA